MEPATLIGERFRVVRPIREGGMGTVFWARDEQLGCDVALKIAPHGLQPEVSARFLREARIAKALRSPNLVRVLDAGELEIEGAPHLFLAMELLRGEPLSDRLEPGEPLSTAEILGIAAAVCRGLEVAHAAGVVHRDVKPENIFLAVNDDGAVIPKLLDFGVSTARTLSSGDRITEVGDVLGTPAYMSPEQARGQIDVGPASDLWAIGVVLYEALSGKQPFAGQSPVDLFRSISDDDPESLPAGVGEATRAIVARCLHKDPARRYREAATLRADLERALAEEQARAEDPDPFSQRDEPTPGPIPLSGPPLPAVPPSSRADRRPRQALGRGKSPALIALAAIGLCVAAVAAVPRKHHAPVRAEAGLARVTRALVARVKVPGR